MRAAEIGEVPLRLARCKGEMSDGMGSHWWLVMEGPKGRKRWKKMTGIGREKGDGGWAGLPGRSSFGLSREFAAKVAGALKQDSVSVGMAVRGIAGRQLVSGDWKRELRDAYIYSGEDIETNLMFSTPDILARPREAGVQVTQRLIKPFGLNVPDQVLIDWQDQVFSRR